MTDVTMVNVTLKYAMMPHVHTVDMTTVSKGSIVPSNVLKLKNNVSRTTTMTSGIRRVRSESMKLRALSARIGSPYMRNETLCPFVSVTIILRIASTISCFCTSFVLGSMVICSCVDLPSSLMMTR